MVLGRVVKVGLVVVPVAAAAAEVTRLTYKYPLRGPEPYHEIPALNPQKATYVYTRVKLPRSVVALEPGAPTPAGPQSREEGRQQAAAHAAEDTEHKAVTPPATPKAAGDVSLPTAPAPTALGMFTAAFWGSLPFVIEGWVAEHAAPSAPPHWQGALFDAPSFVGGMFTVAKRTATSLVVSYNLPPSPLDAYVDGPSHGHQEIAAVPVGNDELEISYGDAHFMKGTAEDEGPIAIRIHHLYMRVVLEWARRRLEHELANVSREGAKPVEQRQSL